MKARYMGICLAMALGALTSCMDKDWDIPSSIQNNPPYGNNSIQKSAAPITVQELKAKYASIIDGNNCAEITENLQLQVIVNGNDAGGNIYKQISVQDATGGIIVGINGTDLFPYMPVGQKLFINLKGLYVGGYGQQAQIGSLYNGGIGRMDTSTWQEHVRLVSDDVFSAKVDTVPFDSKADMNSLCGRIVVLNGVTISGEGTQVLAPGDGTVSLTSNCANRNINGSSSVVLRTSTYSDFASRPMPKGKVTLYGVCTRFRNTWQILMRTESDLKE